MVAISSSVGAVRASFQQAVAPQLRAAAERAQRNADFLQAQAREAWQKVEAAETNARVADGRASDALSTAARAQDNLLSFVTRSRAAAPARPTAEPVAPTEAQSTPQGVTPEPVIPQAVPAAPLRVNVPSVNNLGQSVGAIINVTA